MSLVEEQDRERRYISLLELGPVHKVRSEDSAPDCDPICIKSHGTSSNLEMFSIAAGVGV